MISFGSSLIPLPPERESSKSLPLPVLGITALFYVD